MSIYDLPDLRPFRVIQNRMRLQGGAVVTQHGSLASDDFATGVSGWQINGDGDVEFNDGVFRGVIDASGLNLSISATDDGSIEFYDAGGVLVGRLSADEWALGDLTTPGQRLTMDHVGGIRFRSAADLLTVLLDQNGLSFRDETSGLVVAEMAQGTMRLVDPDGTDDIELVTQSTDTLPNPNYRSAVEASPGSSLVVPAAPTFTVPQDDFSVGHVASFLGGTAQAATHTAPGSWTERSDADLSPAGSTLAVSIATRTPATGATGTFTSSQSNWQHGIGTHVVLKGGGSASPSYRAVSELETSTTDTVETITMSKPTGTVADDVLVAFVSIGNYGGGVPTGWETPDGWVFLGANLRVTGSGASMSTLAVGTWAKLAGASEPSSYDATINLGAGTKTIHAAIVAVQDCFLVPGGVQIRLAGHPIKRLLDQVQLTSASGTLADFTNIPQSYDHLEVVFNGTSDRNTDVLRNIRVRVNADSGANYHTHINRTGVYNQALSTTSWLVACINGAFTGHPHGGAMRILNYTKPQYRMCFTEALSVIAGTLIHDDHRGLWLNTTDAIDQVTIEVDGGTVLFDVGSTAYLYGY